MSADADALAEMREKTGKSYVPQVLIGGEYVGGYDEFLLKDAMGEIDRMLGITREKKEEAPGEIYDLVIIGGGPAGLTAAVYAARKNLKTLLVADQLGGQPMITAGIENYMGFQYVTGPELMDKFEDQTSRYPVREEVGQPVTRLELNDRMKKVTMADGQVFTGRTVVVASGKRSRRLGIPGEQEFSGCGVSYCATCDAPLFRGQPVMVAGGGNSGMQAALELAAMTPEVSIVCTTELTGDEILKEKVLAEKRIRKYLLYRVVEIKGDGCVRSAVIESLDGKDRQELQVNAVFVEIGLEPNSGFAVDLLELNRKGEIVVDYDCRTGVSGIFAAGDVTQVRDKQIVVAAGEGCKAALSAHEYLLAQR